MDQAGDSHLHTAMTKEKASASPVNHADVISREFIFGFFVILAEAWICRKLIHIHCCPNLSPVIYPFYRFVRSIYTSVTSSRSIVCYSEFFAPTIFSITRIMNTISTMKSNPIIYPQFIFFIWKRRSKKFIFLLIIDLKNSCYCFKPLSPARNRC